jgi:hypothetical protein
MDGTVRLFHISGKRLLQTFVHCTPQKVDAGPAAGVGEEGPGGMAEGGSEGEEDEEGEEELEEVKAVECVGFAAKDLK